MVRSCSLRRLAGGVFLGSGLLLAVPLGGAGEPAAVPAGEVRRVRLASIIHPVAAEFVSEALREADAAGAAALVIELDTPGGLLTSTRAITTAMLGARTPVIVYVAPDGAQAASAGFFLLMAADLAAMAPGTNTGAAHPVGAKGENLEGVLGEKVEQDAAANIRALAARHGRNPALAEAAVRESRSFTAEEALAAGLVEVLASDTSQLLRTIDGRRIAKAGADGPVLRTAGAPLREVEMSAFQRVRSTLAHPDIAYLLLALGGLGLYFELATPGAVLPGVIGAICLVLAFASLSVLPVDYAGVALLVLAAIFFIAEVKVTSYGLLSVAGVVALVLGSLMLFKSADPALRVSRALVAGVAVAVLAAVALLATLVVRTHRRPVATGVEGMLHERGVARSDLLPAGRVFVHGEIWDAVADQELPQGTPVEVLAVEGRTLRVRKAPQA